MVGADEATEITSSRQKKNSLPSLGIEPKVAPIIIGFGKDSQTARLFRHSFGKIFKGRYDSKL